MCHYLQAVSIQLKTIKIKSNDFSITVPNGNCKKKKTHLSM